MTADLNAVLDDVASGTTHIDGPPRRRSRRRTTGRTTGRPSRPTPTRPSVRPSAERRPSRTTTACRRRCAFAHNMGARVPRAVASRASNGGGGGSPPRRSRASRDWRGDWDGGRGIRRRMRTQGVFSCEGLFPRPLGNGRVPLATDCGFEKNRQSKRMGGGERLVRSSPIRYQFAVHGHRGTTRWRF